MSVFPFIEETFFFNTPKVTANRAIIKGANRYLIKKAFTTTNSINLTNYKKVEYPKRFTFSSEVSVKESCFLSVIKNSSTFA